ncbi:class I SAM-dependent methyltransferase [Mesorhizobium huakuii]|uniref:Class I SAM-dependent methyltransferase n=1 Tax=Mesorhizobium huakuii TaxID=28104 RepID=A0ABZ0VK72_9HYPH|nr:class I SAM-dependent methyltransferase [Mesorhizobium huakuii]WQB97847.1 class I SAM-dependent methyltransferase [Mesorhizobium huakuii]
MAEHDELTRLRAYRSYNEQRLAQGFIIEMDYPYQPRVRQWDDLAAGSPIRSIISARDAAYSDVLREFLGYRDRLLAISANEPPDSEQPYWSNDWLPPLDGISIYGLLTKLNPRFYVEVGSGNSTKFARRAIRDNNLRTTIISIDPFPRAEIDGICDRVIRSGLQDTDLSLFFDLGAEDIVFIDNSHRSFQNSDVTVFFTEILPTLKSGCHYGIHDIFLPLDYPEEWLGRFYNEQYLLQMYLLGGAGGDEIILPMAHIRQQAELLAILDPITKGPSIKDAMAVGGAFWMRRR